MVKKKKQYTITQKRLKELDRNVIKSMGWNANESENERKIIMRRWDKMSGKTSFHDAIRKMIKRKRRKK